MPTVASRREQSLSDTVKFLAVHLEIADTLVRKAAQPDLDKWEAVDAKAGRKTTEFDRGHVLACIHQQTCKKRKSPADVCEGCAISSAILLACVVADEQEAHDLADAVGSLMRGLSALEAEIVEPLERFEKSNVMRREPSPLPDDLERRAVAPAIRRVFSVARELLQDVPHGLHPEDIYDGLRASPERRPGPKSDGITVALADIIKRMMGCGDRRAAELMGLERDDIRRGRKRRAGGLRHKLN